MSKYVSESGLPYGVHYQIHSHNGLNGKEREAHVHIRGKGCDVKYSLNTGKKIEGEFGSVSEKDIERWVNNHLSELMDEWDDADDPKGGR